MTIQPNVLIWTILCFCAFMFILWRLLLKPLLAFMDARNERIAHARSLDKTAEREAKLARLEEERQTALRLQAEQRQQAVLRMREEAQAELDAQALDFQREIKERRQALQAEAAGLVPELAVSLKDHVDAFTDKLTAYGEGS